MSESSVIPPYEQAHLLNKRLVRYRGRGWDRLRRADGTVLHQNDIRYQLVPPCRVSGIQRAGFALLPSHLSSRRNTKAAYRFMGKLLNNTKRWRIPRLINTD